MEKNYLAIMYMACATLSFSSMELAGKFVVGHLSAYQVNFFRFGIGLLLLLPLAIRDARKRQLKLSWNDLGWLALLGICNIALAMVFLQKAVTLIPASLAAVIISSNPIFVVIFANFILNEIITVRKIAGLVLGVVGLIFVTNVLNAVSNINWVGLAYAVSAALFFGLYTVLSKKVVGRLGGMVTNVGSFFIGCLVILCILLLKGDPIFAGINRQTVFPIIYLGVVVTGFAYFTFLRGLSLIDASKGSIVFFFKPVIASLLAFFILHETIGLNLILGTILIIMGSALMVFKNGSIPLSTSTNNLET